MTIGVLVVAWRNAAEIERCLAALLRSRLPGGVLLHVVVVDNASRDGTAEVVRGRFPEVELIANLCNRMYAAATNQALARLHGDYVLFLNPDVEMSDDCLATLLTVMEGDGSLAGVAPRMTLPDGTTERSCRHLPDYATLLSEATGLSRLSRRFDRWRYSEEDHASTMDVEQPMASCLLMRDESLIAVGRRLDERLPLYFNDVELSLRLKRSGFKLRYVASAVAKHDHGASTRRSPVRSVVEHSLSFLRYLWGASPGARFNMVWAAPLMCAVGVLRAGLRAFT